MRKLMGAILLAAGCGWIGFRASAELGRRVRALQAVEQGLGLLEQELELDCPPLPQLMERLAARSQEPARGLFLECREALERLERETFSQSWRRLVSGLSILGEEGRACLFPLGDTLGRCGWEEQRRMVGCVRKELSRLLQRAREERGRQGRVYQTLGLSGGVFFVILLL